MKKYTPEEKYQIVTEGRKSVKGVKHVCAKYGVSRETFYQWEARIKEAAMTALEDKSPGPKAPERDQSAAELKKKLEELEIENAVLKLKQEWTAFQIELHGTPKQKKALAQGKKKRYSASEKQWIFEKRIAYERLSLKHYLDSFGLSPSAYHKWAKRDTLECRKPVPKNMPRTTPPEELSRALNTTLNYNIWGGQN